MPPSASALDFKRCQVPRHLISNAAKCCGAYFNSRGGYLATLCGDRPKLRNVWLHITRATQQFMAFDPMSDSTGPTLRGNSRLSPVMRRVAAFEMAFASSYAGRDPQYTRTHKRRDLDRVRRVTQFK